MQEVAVNPLPEAHELPVPVSNPDAECVTRRQKNRRETWLAIHRAAAGLVLERMGTPLLDPEAASIDGPGAGAVQSTTVDAIAERAGISRRTFFNYFPTKEDAILGVRDPFLSEQALHDFRDGEGDAFHRTMRLLSAVLRSTAPDFLDLDNRRTLVRHFPELREHMETKLRAAESLVGKVLASRAASDDASPEIARQEHPQEYVKVLLMLAGTVMRYAAKKDPEAFVRGDTTPLDDAIDTFRAVISETL